MGEFSATITALLDDSALKRIDELDGKIINLRINDNLRSQVENALKGTFSINIVPNIGGNGMKNAAKSAVKDYNAQVQKIVRSGTWSNIADALLAQGISDGAVADDLAKDLTKHFDGAVDIAVKNVSATLKDGRLTKAVVQAEDELGRKITTTTTYNAKGKQSVFARITESYDNTAKSASNAAGSVKKSSKEIATAISRKIATHSVDSAVSGVTAQWEKYQNVAHASKDAMKANYDALKTERDFFKDPNNWATLSDDELINRWKKYSRLLQTAKNDMSILRNEGTKSASPLDIASLDSKMATWMQKNTKAAKKYGATIAGLRDQLQTLGLSEQDRKKIESQFKQIDFSAAAEGLKGATLWDKVKAAGTQMLGFISVYDVIQTATRGFKEMYQAVYDVDTAMTNLKKVTDESDSTYNAFLDRSASSAQSLGRNISSLVEQTATWAKLGYSLNEAESLAKLSSIYANVAEVDDATAVSDMVTAIKAYGLETSDAIRVVDSLNELGNRFAVNAADLGDGLSKSASAMNAAGTDMYKTLAMLTGGSEITQNAGEFGSFLKVASMRIRGMKGELEELGEEVDPAVDSISKVQTQILNLTGGKVNIFDELGQFRDYFDIMKEIATVYDNLSSTDQASLTEILFGKMRGNQGQALLQAFKSGQVQKAYEAAVGSSGSAYEEQSRWMESLEAKTQQFQAAWQGLSQTVLNSDFLKGMVDTGTGALNVLNGIVDTIGVFGTVAAGGGIAAFFKNLD